MKKSLFLLFIITNLSFQAFSDNQKQQSINVTQFSSEYDEKLHNITDCNSILLSQFVDNTRHHSSTNRTNMVKAQLCYVETGKAEKIWEAVVKGRYKDIELGINLRNYDLKTWKKEFCSYDENIKKQYENLLTVSTTANPTLVNGYTQCLASKMCHSVVAYVSINDETNTPIAKEADLVLVNNNLFGGGNGYISQLQLKNVWIARDGNCDNINPSNKYKGFTGRDSDDTNDPFYIKYHNKLIPQSKPENNNSVRIPLCLNDGLDNTAVHSLIFSYTMEYKTLYYFGDRTRIGSGGGSHDIYFTSINPDFQ